MPLNHEADRAGSGEEQESGTGLPEPGRTRPGRSRPDAVFPRSVFGDGFGRALASALLALSLAGAPLAAAAAGEDAAAEKGGAGLELVLIHTNDTHAHVAGLDQRGNAGFDPFSCAGGYGRVASFILERRAGADNVLALDAGDFFQGSLYYSVFKDAVLREVVPRVPYDAVTLGNHEWDEGCAVTKRWAESLPVPVLAANLVPKEGCPLAESRVGAARVFPVRGVPVGVIGLASDEPGSRRCPATAFADAEETARRCVADLKARGVEHIVLLTHLGLDRDLELAARVEGVDVVVGGHTHALLGPGRPEGPYPTVVRSPSGNPVLVVTAGRATRHAGELRVRFTEEGVPASWSGGPVELLPVTVPCSAEIASLVDGFTEKLATMRTTVVGRLELAGEAASLPDGLDMCRVDDCAGGLVFADAALDYGRPAGARMALVNGGGVRASLPRGEVSLGDLVAAFPFGNTVVLRRMTGEAIRAALENGLAENGGTGPHLLQVAGLTYEADGRKAPGSRVGAVSVEKVAGGRGTGQYGPLDPRATYVVAVIDFLAEGNDGFSSVAQAPAVPFADALDIDVLRARFAKGPVTVEHPDRIVRLDRIPER